MKAVDHTEMYKIILCDLVREGRERERASEREREGEERGSERERERETYHSQHTCQPLEGSLFPPPYRKKAASCDVFWK